MFSYSEICIYLRLPSSKVFLFIGYKFYFIVVYTYSFGIDVYYKVIASLGFLLTYIFYPVDPIKNFLFILRALNLYQAIQKLCF